MRKDRDCGVSYPIYTPYQGMPVGMPMPMNYQTQYSNQNTINNIDQQINNIEQ